VSRSLSTASVREKIFTLSPGKLLDNWTAVHFAHGHIATVQLTVQVTGTRVFCAFVSQSPCAARGLTVQTTVQLP